jgi:hypothetical protein
VPVPRTELWPAAIPLVPRLSYLSFFVVVVFLFSYRCNIYIYIHIYIEKPVLLHPYVTGSPTVASRGPGTQVSHTVPFGWGRPS